jgi:hypothetical protein
MSGHTCFRIYFKPEGSLTLSSTFGHTLDTTVVDVSLLMFCIVMLLCKVFNTWMEAQANYLPGSNMPHPDLARISAAKGYIYAM